MTGRITHPIVSVPCDASVAGGIEEQGGMPIEYEREVDGRWIADLPSLPGVMAYGDTQDDARRKVVVLAFHVIADRVENQEALPPELFDDLRELVAFLREPVAFT